ncbi:phage tail length tape measure family protein [Shinella sp. M27]|uniref:phage tail length tape measure family protein n=1 Tax=Shinella sp. M27 TaxID=3368614 RepID=UPI003BA06246
MTTAVLGLKIDSSEARSATVDLDRFEVSAVKLEKAADSLAASAGALAGALKKVGDETKKVPPVAKPFENQDEHVKAFRAEIERLTTKYQPLAQATKNYEASISEINRAHQIGVINAQQMQKALDAERMAYDRLKTSAMGANQAVVAANQNNPSGAQRAAGINAGYQFQDIAVTAAMGMNPLMIGLQQGTQLASVLATMERPVAGLAAAFASIISPVTLVTVGLVAGVSALVQYFTTAESGTEKTARLFEEQNETIRRAAELWGDAAPALKAYVDELDRADKIAKGREAGGILAGRELEGLSANLDNIKVKAVEALRSLRGDPSNAVVVRDLVSAWGDLRERLDNGTASMADLNRVQSQLATAVSSYGTPQVLAFSKAFDEVTAAIYRGVEAAQKARTEWIAAIAGGTNVQDIVEGSTFNDNGTMRRPSDFVPRVPGVPVRRPSDLSRDPDPSDTRILNSDGRLTGVPIPGQKPNFFELEKENEKVDDLTKAYRRAQEAKADFWLDLSFSERQAGRSAMDQRIASTLTRYGFDENLQSPEAEALRKQMREGEAKDLFKGFFSGVYQEAWSNGGKIGDAIVKSALNAAQKAAEKAWDSIFDSLATKLGAWLTSGADKGAGTVAAGFSPTTTLGAVLGAGGAANDNKASASIPTTDVGAYIAQAAIKRGIDPKTALAVARSEGGLNSWNLQSRYVKNGVQEPSFGPYQLYMGGGLGNAFQKQTGLDPRLAANGPAGVDFALDHAAKNGWGAWYGAKNTGIGNWEGIGTGGAGSAVEAVNKLAESAGAATKGLDTLGGGLGKIGESLSTSFFPSTPAGGATSTGGGGLFSWLGGLFGGGQWGAAKSGLLKPGLFANGTGYASGGLSIVGDKGPELLNIPTGSGIMSNDKLAAALNDNRSSQAIKGQRPELKVYVQGANGDAQIRQMAQQGARDALVEYDKMLERGRFGDVQQDYQANKG